MDNSSGFSWNLFIDEGRKMISLSVNKGNFSGTETPLFTITYDVAYEGKEVYLSTQDVTGGYTMVAKAPATSQGLTTFTYRPSNQGTYVFVAQVGPCFIFFNCETSNKITISIIGDLPCNPLDPLCNIGKAADDFKWIAYLIIIVIIFMIAKDIGILQRLRGK